MIWSVEVTGLKAAVRTKAEAEFDRAAKSYAGTEEEKDVLAAKDRALSTVDLLQPVEYANGVAVRCSGSRGDGYTSISVSVTRVQLTIE